MFSLWVRFCSCCLFVYIVLVTSLLICSLVTLVCLVHLHVTVKLVSLCELLSDPVFQYITTLSLLFINFLQVLNK